MLTPRKVNGNSKGEGGFQNPNFLNESTTQKWNSWRGGGDKLKKPSVGEVWIFSGTTLCTTAFHNVLLALALISHTQDTLTAFHVVKRPLFFTS